MLSQPEQAILNLEQARGLRASGTSYRQIGRQLGLTSGQLSHIRRTLKREKGARTRLRSTNLQATDRDLPVNQSVLPYGLRHRLTSSGYRTLGDLADRLADPDFPGLETMPGIGPHRARLVKRVLDHFGLLPGPSDLQAEIERIFPEFSDAPPGAPDKR
ncbi:hypothetical protein ACVWZA_003360 [Sphingomonas sp. UYAg733]